MRFRLHCLFLVLVPLALSPATRACAAKIEVPAMQPTIQDGLDAAASGDTVLVAPGTYTGPGNRDLDFAGKTVRLFSTGGAAVTIVDIQGDPGDPHRGILFDDNELGIFVRGFRFINGCAPGTGGTSDGGAVLMDGQGLALSVVFQECEFFLNEALDFGGAVAVRGQASATFVKCDLAGNIASSGGALSVTGAFSVHLTECSLTGNLASGGGAMFINDCVVTGNLTTITGNRATNIGGGIFNQVNAGAELDFSIIWGNCADVAGSEIYAQVSGHSEFHCSDINQFQAIFVGSTTVTYGSDVIDQDPLFCGPAPCGAPTITGNYRLGASSPCLGVNNNCGSMGRFPRGCSVLGLPGDVDRTSGSGLRVSPNPASGPVRIIRATGAESLDRPGVLYVYRVDGRRVRDLKVGPGETIAWDGRGDDGQRVAAGMYLLRLVGGGEAATGRVIVAR